MSTYFLAPHVYVCHSRGATVLLDLHNDRYLALSKDSSAALSALVAGWNLSLKDAQIEACGGQAIAEQMESQGLLTRSELRGKPASPPKIETPTQALTADDPWKRPAVRIAYLFTFVLAILTALLLLRFSTLEKTVGRIEIRKLRQGGRSASVDKQRLSALVTAFSALTPFAFTSRNACMFHSLALLEFLSLHGIEATWVFGVRSPPFAAHCWIQWRDIVLNDAPERAKRFQPIMIV